MRNKELTISSCQAKFLGICRNKAEDSHLKKTLPLYPQQLVRRRAVYVGMLIHDVNYGVSCMSKRTLPSSVD